MSSSSSLQQHDRSRKDQGNAPNYEAFENYNSDVRDNTSNPQHHTTKNGRGGEGQNSGPLHCSSSSSSSRLSSSHRSRRSKSHSVSHEGSYSSSSARSSPRSFRRSFSSSSSSLSQDGSEIVKDATSRAEQLRNENNTKKESTLRALLLSQTATTAKARTASASSPSRYPAQPSEKINDFTPFTSSEEIELILDSKFPYPAPNRIQQSKLDYYLNSVRGPRFSSAVEAKAFLYSTHRLLQTEDTLRESIEKGCEELLSDWLPHKATLLLLHERDQREILQLLLRERKYRAFVEEEAAEDWEAEITTPLLEAHLFYEKGGLTLASLPILAAFEEDEGNERRCLEYVEDKESGQLFELMIDELVDIEQREELANDNLDSEKNRQSREEGDNNYKSSQKYNNLARNHESTVSSRSAAGKTSSDRGAGEENAGGGLFSIGADGEVVFVGDNGPVPVSSSHQSHKVNASPVKKHDDDVDRTAMLLMVATTVGRRRNADSPLPARSTSLATEGSCSLSQASCLDGRTAAFRQKEGGCASVSARSGIGPFRSSHHVGAPYNSIAPLSMADLNKLRASRNGTPNAAARNPLNPYNYGFDRSSGAITPLGRAGVPLRARSGGSSSPRSPCPQQEGDEGQNKEEKEPRSWWSRASSTSNFSSSRYGSPACSNTNGGDGSAQHHHNYDRWSENSLQLFTHSHHKSDRTFAADYVAHQLVANRIKVRELGDARRADAAEANRVAAQRTKEENLLLRQALERANIKALRRSFAHVVKRRDEHKSQRKTFEATRAAYHAKLRKGHSTKYLAYKWDLHMSKYGPLEAAKLEVLLKSPPRSPSPTAGRGDGKSATDEETNRLPVLSVGGSDSKEHQQEMARRRRRPSYASPTARSLSIAVVNTSKQHEHEAGHRSRNGSRPNSPPPLLSSSVSTRDALLPPPPLADLRPNTPSHARAVAGLAPLPAFKMPPKVVFGQRPASSPFYSSTHTTSPLRKKQPNKIKQQVAGDLSGGGAASSFSNGPRRLAPIGRTAPYRPASSASQLNHPSAGAVAGNSHSLSTSSSYSTLGAPVAVSSGGNGSRRPKTAVDHTTFSASSASNPQARRGGPNGGYYFTNVLRNAPLSLSSSSISNAPTAVAAIAAKRTPSTNKPTHNEADNSIATTKKSRGGQRKGVLPVIIHPTETKLVRTAQCYATMLSSGGIGKESRANVDGKGEKKPQEQPRIQLDVTSVSSNARAPIAFVLTTKQKQSSGAQNAGAGAGVSSCETATVASVFAASLFTHLQSLEHEEVTDIGTLYERAAWCFSKSKSLVATAQQQRAMEGGKHEDESHHHQPQQLLRQADALLMEGERILRRLEEAHDDDDDDSMIPHCVPNKPSVSLTLGEGEEEGTVDDNNLHQNNANNIFVFDHHATVHCLKVLRGGASASVLRATRQLSLALKALEEVAALESKGVMPMKMTSSPQKPIRLQQQQQQQRSEPSDHHHRPNGVTCAVALDLENDTKDTAASNRKKNKKKSNKSGGASRGVLSEENTYEMKEGSEEDRKTPKKKEGTRDREKTNSPRSADRSPSAYSDDFVSDLEENKKEDYGTKNDVDGSKHDDGEEGDDTYTPYASSAASSSAASPTSSRASYSPSSSRTSSPPPTHLAQRSEDETTVTQRHEAAKTANTMIKMEGTGTIYSGKGNKSPRRSPDRYQQQQQQQNQRVNPHNGMPEFILVDYSRGVKGGTFSKASKPVSGRHGLDDPSSNTNKSISAKSNAAHRTRSNPNNNSSNREEGEEHDDENTAHNAKRTATNPVTLANLAAICTALGRAEEAIAYGRKASEAVTDQLEANVEAVVAALRKADDTTHQRTTGKSDVKADGIDSDAETRPQLEGLTEKAREDTTRSQDDGGHKGNDSAAAIVVRVPIPFPDALEMSVTVLTTIAAAQLSQGRSTRSAAVPKVGPRPLGSMPSERASAPRTYRLALGLAEEVLGGGHPITSYCQRCVDGLLGEDGK